MSKLIVFLCLFVGEVLLVRTADSGGSAKSVLAAPLSCVPPLTGEPDFGGDEEGRSSGLGCKVGLPSETTLSSLRSNLLTKLEFELPHVLAKMPFGIPYRPVALPRMPCSPEAATAALLKLVGAGALARVDGARLLGGISRRASVNASFGVAGSSAARFTEGKLGPTGIDP